MICPQSSPLALGWGSALSPILSALCLASLVKEFERRVCVAVLISYVDDTTIIVQSDTWDKNLVQLKLAYKVVFELTQSMRLVLEHNKSEGFHFSRKPSDSNPDINLGYAPYTGATPLHPGTTWWYLGFFFDHALTFWEHVKHYTNKALTTVRAMLALGNSVCGLRPKHKQMLYRACVLPIATYGSRLWLYEGAAMKGPLDSLWKMQRHTCLWIIGAFKTSPMGAAETLAGVPPIHLHVKKLVEQSHVRTRALQASHTFRRLVDGDHKSSVETHKGQIRGDLKSPITEAWLNLDLSSLDLDPVNRFNQPGLCPKDLYHGRIVYDIVSSPPKTDKDHKKFMADRINLLRGSIDAASNSPQRICIVTDASTPSLPLQSVAAFRLWHEGDLYDDWSAAGLSMSDDAKLRAIADRVCQAYNVGLEDVQQVHVFSDSANALCLTMDVSHHLGQHSSLSICRVLVPWLQHHPNNCVHFHHITPGVELEDHQLTHILATSTRIKAGGAPVISAGFARRRAVTQMLEGWNSLFQSKKYIRSNFLTLYQRKDIPFVLTHVKSGSWMRKAGHSHSLTACLVRCTTGHDPIRAYCSRFFPEESTACRCGFPMETVSHVLYRCLSHERGSDPKEQLRYSWLFEFLEANESAFTFDVP
jgi:hypothetical protein